MNTSDDRGHQLVTALRESSVRVHAEAALAEFTTFGIGGPALVLGEPNNNDELEDLVTAARDVSLPIVVVGQGSNLLVADTGVAALVVILRGSFAEIHADPHDATVINAGGAVKLPVLARRTAAMGLVGLEWAVGVPGSVGGAVRMNAGGHGSDMAANLVSASVIETANGSTITTKTREELTLSYRSSSIQPDHIVTGATFQLTAGEVSVSEAEIRDIVRWRREHQPGGANCGSVFTNPPGDSAGRLIDAAGLKGHRIGSAEVSTKHANFIQADPHARQQDISALIVYVQTVVRERFGIELHAEVQTLGITTYQRVS
jgi:UDP-N-acetylmuramate dehydrogenase